MYHRCIVIARYFGKRISWMDVLRLFRLFKSRECVCVWERVGLCVFFVPVKVYDLLCSLSLPPSAWCILLLRVRPLQLILLIWRCTNLYHLPLTFQSDKGIRRWLTHLLIAATDNWKADGDGVTGVTDGVSVTVQNHLNASVRESPFNWSWDLNEVYIGIRMLC